MIINFERKTVKTKGQVYENEQTKDMLVGVVKQYFSKIGLTSVRLQRFTEIREENFISKFSGKHIGYIESNGETFKLEVYEPSKDIVPCQKIPKYLNDSYREKVNNITIELEKLGIRHFAIEKDGIIALRACLEMNDIIICCNVKIQPFMEGVY